MYHVRSSSRRMKSCKLASHHIIQVSSLGFTVQSSAALDAKKSLCAGVAYLLLLLGQGEVLFPSCVRMLRQDGDDRLVPLKYKWHEGLGRIYVAVAPRQADTWPAELSPCLCQSLAIRATAQQQPPNL